MKKYLVILTLILSSCSQAVINGVRIPDKKQSARLDEKTIFVMTVSFWLSYGISYHFMNTDQ